VRNEDARAKTRGCVYDGARLSLPHSVPPGTGHDQLGDGRLDGVIEMG